MKLARLSPPDREAADHQPPDCESGKRQKAAGQGTERDCAESKGFSTGPRAIGRSPDSALLPVFVQYLMHSGKALQREP